MMLSQTAIDLALPRFGMIAKLLSIPFTGFHESLSLFFDHANMIYAVNREIPVVLPHAPQYTTIAGFDFFAKLFNIRLARSTSGHILGKGKR